MCFFSNKLIFQQYFLQVMATWSCALQFSGAKKLCYCHNFQKKLRRTPSWGRKQANHKARAGAMESHAAGMVLEADTAAFILFILFQPSKQGGWRNSERRTLFSRVGQFWISSQEDLTQTCYSISLLTRWGYADSSWWHVRDQVLSLVALDWWCCEHVPFGAMDFVSNQPMID